MLHFKSRLNVWTNGEGSSHFVTIPEQLAGEIRAQACLVRRGFGSAKVRVSINGTRWQTSVFPKKDGGYFLPVKVSILRETGIAAGEEVAVTIELL